MVHVHYGNRVRCIYLQNTAIQTCTKHNTDWSLSHIVTLRTVVLPRWAVLT